MMNIFSSRQHRKTLQIRIHVVKSGFKLRLYRCLVQTNNSNKNFSPSTNSNKMFKEKMIIISKWLGFTSCHNIFSLVLHQYLYGFLIIFIDLLYLCDIFPLHLFILDCTWKTFLCTYTYTNTKFRMSFYVVGIFHRIMFASGIALNNYTLNPMR